MAGFGVKFKFDKARSFFNSKAVTKRVDATAGKVLRKFGGFVKRTARQSISKGKSRQISRAGHPPKGHTGLLKNRIFFWFSDFTRSVIIGPEKVQTKGDVKLSALEHGGRTTFRPRRRRGARQRPTKNVFIQARPFMGPALMENEPKLSGMWKDSVKAR